MMEITDKELALIDRFLREELSDEERLKWEDEYMQDPQFVQAFHQNRDLVEAIRSDGREQLRTRIQNWSKKETPSSSRRMWFRSAAAACAVLLVAAFFLLRNSGPDLIVFDEPFPDILSEVTRSEAMDSRPYAKLMRSYNNRRWKAAEKEFSAYLQEHPEDFAIWMYGGIAAYHAGHYDRSVDLLEIVPILTIDETFVQPAQWFEILSLLKLENNRKAKIKIHHLLTKDHYKSEQARSLLDKL